MRFIRVAAAMASLIFAVGCSSNESPAVPACDDARVRELIGDIVKSNGIELASLDEIATESSAPDENLCRATAKIKYDGMEKEGPFEYAVTLDANKEDFIVKILTD
ncbi:MAG: hypothetical protein K2H64_04585 [Desulfovibrio sp.]|nr:hypothetical protein [Desulfovibrio sp.]